MATLRKARTLQVSRIPPSSTTDGAPTTFRLAKPTASCILATGSEMKSTVCFCRGQEAVLSPALGNLTDPQVYRQYVQMIEQLREKLGFTADLVAHDLHPLYVSTRYAKGLGLPTVAVQHHHAHVVSIMVDHGVDKPIVGICCDGVGYGTDGAAWGCEILACDAAGFERLSHLEYFPLVGGDAAAIHTWRPAASLLEHAFGADWRSNLTESFDRVPREELDRFAQALKAKINSPMTSSLGRVFDGISFLLGLCDKNEREAQAAIALEAAASDLDVEPYPYETTTCGGSFKMSLAPMVRAIVQDVRAKRSTGAISARFHETVARMLTAVAVMACEMTGASTAVLSGGCFANRRLRERLTERLGKRHLTVLLPTRVSCGDAALALGQAVIAAAMQERAGSCA